MPIPSRLPLPLAVAALAGTAALSLPAVAGAAPDAKFIASFEGSQATSYNEPKHNNLVTCGGTNGRSMKSTEVVRVRTGNIKVGAHRVGQNIFWSYGSFNLGPGGTNGIPGRMTVARTSKITFFNEPGSCGIGGGPSRTLPSNCPNQSIKVNVSIQSDGRQLSPSITAARTTPFQGYLDCIGIFPTGVAQGQLTRISQDAPASDLLDPGLGKHIILASKSFSQSYHLRFNGQAKATTTVRWALTLKRVR